MRNAAASRMAQLVNTGSCCLTLLVLLHIVAGCKKRSAMRNPQDLNVMQSEDSLIAQRIGAQHLRTLRIVQEMDCTFFDEQLADFGLSERRREVTPGYR